MTKREKTNAELKLAKKTWRLDMLQRMEKVIELLNEINNRCGYKAVVMAVDEEGNGFGDLAGFEIVDEPGQRLKMILWPGWAREEIGK